MKNKASSKILIEFCQIMQVAMQDSVPLPTALKAYSSSNLNQEAAALAEALAKDLEEGKTVHHASKRVQTIDPVLAKLLPFILEKKLVSVLERYLQFLIVLENLTEKASTLAFYPFIISVLLLATLLHLNFYMFPNFYDFFTAEALTPSLTFRLLYFAKIAYWPFSLLIPSLIVAFVYFSFNLAFKANSSAQALYSHIYQASSALQKQEISRVQNIIALFLRAGQTLETSIALASQLTLTPYDEELQLVLSNLQRGNGIDFSFSFSKILTYVSGDNISNEELAARLERAAAQNNKVSALFLNIINQSIGIVLLVVIALLVASIASGTLGLCHWLIWSL